jgi:hypothetical protein
LYSTLVGGNNNETGIDITIDHSGNAFVTGLTASLDFPTTSGANDSSYNGGFIDIFVFKLNSDGSTLFYSTYIGGNNNDLSDAITVDQGGCAFITGHTLSSNFPITSNANDSKFNGFLDCYVLVLNPMGSKIFYSSFVGGSNINQGRSIAVDSSSNVYVTGNTGSSDFYTTPGAFNEIFNGGGDIFLIKFYLPSYFNIYSVSLLINSTPTDIVYSRYRPYTFQVKIINTINISDLKDVLLKLDPSGINLQLFWDSTTGQFSELLNPNKFINLNSSSSFRYNNNIWIIDFNVTFNWNYPTEKIQNVQAVATSAMVPSIWFNSTGLYKVENDLVFNGTLSVKNESDQNVPNGDQICGGEKLNWTGLIPVYENTTDIYPQVDEFDITIRDENGNSWFDSPAEGEPFNIEIPTPNSTKSSFNYTINLTGIPQECDKTNVTFTIRIDGNNVSFSNPRPEADKWQRTQNVFTGVTISDTGGGFVNGSSVKYHTSNDNGSTWSDWENISDLNSGNSITIQKFINFKDGNDNLIKWRATDSVGNGPTESEPYRVLVDTENIIFSNPIPEATRESPDEEVTVGITISDNSSGVNASTIKYSVSTNSGITWSTYKSAQGSQDGNIVNVKFNLTFPNGTGNRIRWYAFDIAGNGPTVSNEYIINVNKIIPPELPEVGLLYPRNASILAQTVIEFSWELMNLDLVGVTYDLIYDNISPPVKNKHLDLNYPLLYHFLVIVM